MKYWEIIADKLSAAGWTWAIVALLRSRAGARWLTRTGARVAALSWNLTSRWALKGNVGSSASRAARRR